MQNADDINRQAEETRKRNEALDRDSRRRAEAAKRSRAVKREVNLELARVARQNARDLALRIASYAKRNHIRPETRGRQARAAAAPLRELGEDPAWWVRSGRAEKFLRSAKPVITDLGETFGPPLMETMARYTEGQAAMVEAVVPLAAAQTLGGEGRASARLCSRTAACRRYRPRARIPWESAGPDPDGPS
jgi:hypothetical protein